MPELRFSDLSVPRQAFLRRCQRIGFGRIESLEVRDSEPVFGSQTQAFIDLKLDRDEHSRLEQDLGDFVVRVEIQRLFSKLDAIRNGVVEHLEVRAGIPRRIVFKASDLTRS